MTIRIPRPVFQGLRPVSGKPPSTPAMPGRPRYPAWFTVPLAFLAVPGQAHASLFQGETLDAVANVISWVAIIVGPIIGIVVFWMVHILPEKIAEKRKHPQAKAIQCICLLSLFFGGLLWPIAWLWAYTKPTLHKLAYGTDVDETGHKEKEEPATGKAAAAIEQDKTMGGKK